MFSVRSYVLVHTVSTSLILTCNNVKVRLLLRVHGCITLTGDGGSVAACMRIVCEPGRVSLRGMIPVCVHDVCSPLDVCMLDECHATITRLLDLNVGKHLPYDSPLYRHSMGNRRVHVHVHVHV